MDIPCGTSLASEGGMYNGRPMRTSLVSEGEMSNRRPMESIGQVDRTMGQAWSVRVGCPMDVPWTSIGQVDRTAGQAWSVRVGCQWTPVDNPTCPMVQWDRMDSGIWGLLGGTVESCGLSVLSHCTMG